MHIGQSGLTSQLPRLLVYARAGLAEGEGRRDPEAQGEQGPVSEIHFSMPDLKKQPCSIPAWSDHTYF